jgi:RNA polymerase sigma factor (TIGR02999 family)
MPPNQLATFDDAMFSAVYDELRQVVQGLQRKGGEAMPTAAALLHEAHTRLSLATRFRAESPRDLKWMLVLAMKQILVDAARRKSAAMRERPEAATRRVPLDRGDAANPDADPLAILEVDLALEDLAVRHELPARAFELQFFGGLSIPEIAELLEVSDKKVQRLLKLARTHLAQMMSHAVAT